MNNEILKNYFGYHNLLFLTKDSLENKGENDVNNSLTDLQNAVYKREFLKMKIQVK